MICYATVKPIASIWRAFSVLLLLNLTAQIEALSSVTKFEWKPYYETATGFGADYMIDPKRKGLQSLGEAGVYGEILPSSIKDIIDEMNLSFTPSDRMYDLGSGIGKVVTQFAYETACGHCTGIELGERRHKEGTEVLQSLKIHDISGTCNKISLVKGDCLRVPWGDATVLFINAFCFPKELWGAVEAAIRTQTPNLRYLFLFGSLMGDGKEDKTFPYHLYHLACPSSWSDETLCHLYVSDRELISIEPTVK